MKTVRADEAKSAGDDPSSPLGRSVRGLDNGHGADQRGGFGQALTSTGRYRVASPTRKRTPLPHSSLRRPVPQKKSKNSENSAARNAFRAAGNDMDY
jgi:hypothetical protein